jgi:hypothetical protein
MLGGHDHRIVASWHAFADTFIDNVMWTTSTGGDGDDAFNQVVRRRRRPER